MKTRLLLLALFCTLSNAATAAHNDGFIGAYARAEVGRSRLTSLGMQAQGFEADSNQTLKIFGGYRFDPNWGIELGYAALGKVSSNAGETGRARSKFAAGTARAEIDPSLSVHGRIGASSGSVVGRAASRANPSPVGSENSLMIGLGVEYRFRPNASLTLSADSYGKLTSALKARSVTLGFHINS